MTLVPFLRSVGFTILALFGISPSHISGMVSGIPQVQGSFQFWRTNNVDRYCRRGTFSRMSTNARDRQQWCAPPPAFALSSAPNDFRDLSLQYANTGDPYVNMVSAITPR